VVARAFVTGATGFLGRALVERLVGEGRPVTGLARSESSATALHGLGVDVVRGHVLDGEALASGMEGCDVVFHVAGVNAFCLPDPSEMFQVNVEGSRTVVAAAARAGVGRLVYTSSAATLGEERGVVGREDSAHRGWFLSQYERSKYEAEKAVLESSREAGIEVVCVNPSSVQGPGRTGGTARLLLDYLNGKLGAMVDTRLSLVDIVDCTEGHLLAETRGRASERYVLSGATLTSREAVAVLAEVTGIEGRPRLIPSALAMAGGVLVEAYARLRRRRPPVCREMVQTLLHGHAYDGSRAARELGLRYTPVEATFRRAVAWYVGQGMVSRPLPRIHKQGNLQPRRPGNQTADG
jgi:dihydroflavonol-4-reductase